MTLAIAFQCGPYYINASAPRIVENFVDIAHFPFTHRGLLGDPQFPEVPNYKLVVAEEIVAEDIHFYQPNPEGTGEAKYVSYLYKIVPLELVTKDAPFEVKQEILPFQGILTGIATNKYDATNAAIAILEERLGTIDYTMPVVLGARERAPPEGGVRSSNQIVNSLLETKN